MFTVTFGQSVQAQQVSADAYCMRNGMNFNRKRMVAKTFLPFFSKFSNNTGRILSSENLKLSQASRN